MKNRVYATLSIYSSDQRNLDEILRGLMVQPSRTSSKGDVSALHFSTKDELEGESAEAHLIHIRKSLNQLPKLLSGRKIGDGLGLTMWIFVEVSRENTALNVPADIIAWLSELGCELSIDVWN